MLLNVENFTAFFLHPKERKKKKVRLAIAANSEEKKKQKKSRKKSLHRRRLVQNRIRRLFFWLDSLFLFSLFCNDITEHRSPPLLIVIKARFCSAFGAIFSICAAWQFKQDEKLRARRLSYQFLFLASHFDILARLTKKRRKRKTHEANIDSNLLVKSEATIK